MICLDCGCELIKSTEPIEIGYHGCQYIIKGVEHYACPECGECAFSPEASKMLVQNLHELSLKLDSSFNAVNDEQKD